MVFYGALGLGIYLMMKRNPSDCKNMLHHANNVVKYMPISKQNLDMINLYLILHLVIKMTNMELRQVDL